MARKKIFMIAPDFYGIDKAVRNAFETAGFDVDLKNARKSLSLFERISLKSLGHIPAAKPILRRILKFFLDKDNEGYISAIRNAKPDVLFVIKGETIFPGTLRAVKDELKIPCVAYVWDSPFYSYSPDNPDIYRKSNFAEGMHLYDHIFVYDPYYAEEIKKRGCVNVSYLPLATDTEQFRKVKADDKEGKAFDFDICFVGAPFSNRISILDGLGEFKLAVFGAGWNRWYWSRFRRLPEYYKGKASGQDVLKIYNSSKIVLNIHDPEATYGVNTRTFDIPACGAFELVDFKPELDNLFKAGEEIVYYKNIEELKSLVRFYLDNPEARRRIAEKSSMAVRERHTWNHRIKEMSAVLKNRGLVR